MTHERCRHTLRTIVEATDPAKPVEAAQRFAAAKAICEVVTFHEDDRIKGEYLVFLDAFLSYALPEPSEETDLADAKARCLGELTKLVIRCAGARQP